jgi:acetyl esterase/lipase
MISGFVAASTIAARAATTLLAVTTTFCASTADPQAQGGSATPAPMAAGGAITPAASPGRDTGETATVHRGIEFAKVGATGGDVRLLLDLYLPASGTPQGDRPQGVLVWVHGGAWRAGSREAPDLAGLTARGWALASVDYRLSTQAKFPAAVHDIKAAIRYLRAHAVQYGLPTQPVVIAGSSAGGHLATLVGVTNGVAALEGSVGDALQTSSDVQGIVSLYGASNLVSILDQSTPHGLSVRVPALEAFLGGQPSAVPDVARLASPRFHTDASDPPLLWMHGDQDFQMPINQGHELEGVYRELGLPVQLIVKHGSGHGGPAFTNAESLREIDEFLRRQVLSPKPVGSQAR